MSAARLPSDGWRLTKLHWHGYAGSTPASDTAPQAVLREPSEVATWIAEHADTAELWHNHYLVASRGDSIRHHTLTAVAVSDEQCAHECVRRP